jgi:membrane-associated phospholipid phosphatase
MAQSRSMKRLGVFFFRWLAVVSIPFGLIPCAMLRGIVDDAGLPRLRVIEHLEVLIGLGVTPSERLQDLFHVTGTLTAMDQPWLLIYTMWLPSAWITFLALGLAKGRPLRPYVVNYYVLFYLALLPHLLLPTEPPWMALGGVERTTVAGAAFVRIDTNQVAAFPSLHVAMPVMFALVSRSLGMPKLSLLFAVFAALIGFSVVYLGEHYVIDVAAGVAHAWLSFRLVSWLGARVGSLPILAVAEPDTSIRAVERPGEAVHMSGGPARTPLRPAALTHAAATHAAAGAAPDVRTDSVA